MTNSAYQSSLAFRQAFALVVTLSLMVLLALIAVGFLTMGATSVRLSQQQEAQAIAKANARMALTLAIADLQKHLGADQRVSARADLKFPDSPNLAWTGAWDSTRGDEQTPRWLVSGNEVDGAVALEGDDSVALATYLNDERQLEELRAPLILLEENAGQVMGAYSYWVGDEGIKARSNISKSSEAGEGQYERDRRIAAQTAQYSGLTSLGEEDNSPFPEDVFGRESTLDQRRFVSVNSLVLAGVDHEVPKRYFLDVTTGGYGLPVNVREGGLKNDLSLIFDRSQRDKAHVRNFLGSSSPEPFVYNGASIYRFTVTDKEKFYLSRDLNANAPEGMGPNWGILYNYAHLWQNLSTDQTYDLVSLYPRVGTDVRRYFWLPYRNAGMEDYRWDRQHTNSGVTPVVALLQVGFYLGAEETNEKPIDGDPKNYNKAQFYLQPIFGLWNPYNVPIKKQVYQLEWPFAPYMTVNFQKPGVENDHYQTEIWMREYWNIQDGLLPSEQNRYGASYIGIRTDEVDFEPGEFRLFSPRSGTNAMSSYNTLASTLDPEGVFKFDIKRTSSAGGQEVGKNLLIPRGENYYGWFGDVFLEDMQWEGTQPYFKSKYNVDIDLNAPSFYLAFKRPKRGFDSEDTHLSRYTNIWSGVKIPGNRYPYIPEPIMTDDSQDFGGKMAHLVDSLAAGNKGRIGVWRFQLQNPNDVEDSNQATRFGVDSNPIAPVVNVRFDGSIRNKMEGRGWNVASHMLGRAHGSGASAGIVGDGLGGNRGLVAEGAFWDQAIPEGDPTLPNRWRGYLGGGSTSTTGTTHAIMYDLPQGPLVSVGQFQHAQLSRYQYEPGFVVGNSYANPRIPLNRTTENHVAGVTGLKIVDTSYQINEQLWDDVFFSTLAPDYVSAEVADYDTVLPFEDISSGGMMLPNPRMLFRARSGDVSFGEIITLAGESAPKAMASRIVVEGAFNVNSTSKEAWKAFLSGMGASELPVINRVNKQVSWEKPEGIRFNRFSQVISPEGYQTGGGKDEFWQGWRELSAQELDALAEALVREVRERGPFLSFADFVNRDPESAKPLHQKKGALQAALDEVVNGKIPESMGGVAAIPEGAQFHDVLDGERQVTGHASYLMQGDVLQSLSPVMSVRSDYFKIRSYGESRDSGGKVLAQAWCEAYVQRVPDFVDGSDGAEKDFDMINTVNQTFGRRFQMVSFRWLSPAEI